MDLLKTIGNNLKKLREEKGVSADDVALYLETSRSMYLKYERGESDAKGTRLKQLADYYNVSLDYLFGFTNEKRPGIDKQLEEFLSGLSEEKKKEALNFINYLKNDPPAPEGK